MIKCKFKLLSAIIFLFQIGGNLFGQTKIGEDVNFVKRFMEKYAGEFAFLINDLPEDYLFLCNDRSEINNLKCIPTILHERYHEYNNSLNGPTTGYRNYFFRGKVYRLIKQSVFKTSLMSAIVPTALQHHSNRYQIYVNGLSIAGNEMRQDAGENGIYGLLEELGAYYLSSLSYVREYDYLSQKADFNDPIVGYQYLGGMGSILSSGSEFKLFIGYYLLYARQYRQELYASLINDKEFRFLYRALNDSFTSVIAEYGSNRDKILAGCRNKISYRDGYVILRETNEKMASGDQDSIFLQTFFTKEINEILDLLN